MPGSVDGLGRALDRDFHERRAARLAALAEERADDRLWIAVGPGPAVVDAKLGGDRRLAGAGRPADPVRVAQERLMPILIEPT
jgi:hypothetical protein